MKDLIILTADKNTDFLLRGLLPRIPTVEHLSPFSYDIFVHPLRDAGVYNNAHEFLRPFIEKYKYAIVVLDHEGCGRERHTRISLEEEIESRLANNGWANRVAVLVISPEIENWVWVGEVHVQKIVNWNNDQNIYDWLKSKGYMQHNSIKPDQPKEAFEFILSETRTPRSSSLYQQIAKKASYRQCRDSAFLKMIQTLQQWFAN